MTEFHIISNDYHLTDPFCSSLTIILNKNSYTTVSRVTVNLLPWEKQIKRLQSSSRKGYPEDRYNICSFLYIQLVSLASEEGNRTILHLFPTLSGGTCTFETTKREPFLHLAHETVLSPRIGGWYMHEPGKEWRLDDQRSFVWISLVKKASGSNTICNILTLICFPSLVSEKKI